MGPGELETILAKLPKIKNDNLLVGYDSSDDAAVYKIDENTSIIATLDFFSPMVDNPETFGKIAAANALSDVYAMGGKPIFALNIVCFPENMDLSILEAMLIGGSEKIMEAGATLAGGHSVYDPEIKYGLSVTGMAGKQIFYNNTAQVGDKLILTKPLGVGIIMAANRMKEASSQSLEEAIDSMERLNKYAAESAVNFNITACTDITGFGLLVHMAEMASCHSIALFVDQVPYIHDAYEYAEEFFITAAGQRNRNYFGDLLDVSSIALPMQEILFDPQTSGGLLFAVGASEADDLLLELQKTEKNTRIIGEVIPKDKYAIMLQ